MTLSRVSSGDSPNVCVVKAKFHYAIHVADLVSDLSQTDLMSRPVQAIFHKRYLARYQVADQFATKFHYAVQLAVRKTRQKRITKICPRCREHLHSAQLLLIV